MAGENCCEEILSFYETDSGAFALVSPPYPPEKLLEFSRCGFVNIFEIARGVARGENCPCMVTYSGLANFVFGNQQIPELREYFHCFPSQAQQKIAKTARDLNHAVDLPVPTQMTIPLLVHGYNK